ncbi:hypothetical protein C1645_881488 [Glomus cerebriforme]|uniref:Uncharacterized protein n=1 Tax=Glomus cerebriforme TaxID=658196 RepID=A0A397S5J4_9GLOM|nr:hypothetical protein C1645_881488 [Glomus cerebriforme]
MKDIQRIIRRKSLGRPAFIGSLYNAVRDTFCGTMILKSGYPNDSINRIDIPYTELLYEYEDSFKEKFDKLGIEDELKLSVLTGLVALEDSGKYLIDAKESLKSVKGTLIYKMTSIEENLDIHRDDVKTCISTDGFSNQDATHFVIGIKWGAAIIASFECRYTKEEDKSQIEEALKSYCEKLLLSISGKGRVDVKEEQSALTSHFSMKIFGDVVPQSKKHPESFNEARKVMTELPSYIKNIIMEKETILKVELIFENLSNSKQRLNDLLNDAQLISHLIPDTIFNEIDNRVQEVRIEEARFRQELAECLIKIRSGKVNINELESKIKKFQKSILFKETIMAFIDKHRSVSKMVNLILILKTKRVEYLGKNLTIEHILHKYSNDAVYILLDNDEYFIDNNLSPVHNMFRDLYNSDEGSSKFFIVNLKICLGIKCLRSPAIQLYINGKLNSIKYHNDIKALLTSNLIKFDSQPRYKPNNYPNKKIQLVLPCPQDCPSVIDCNWRCFRCEQNIEYGYNKHLYCGCGETSIDHCKFRCSSPHHIEGFVPFKLNLLNEMLPSTPPEEINILLLGETGVGKSTFINAFVNYLKFDTLDDAKSGDMAVFIPSKFTITNEDCETETIQIGNDDSNELLGNVGVSSTMECKSYVFHAPRNRHIRLIDTPGVGDTRGIDQDKKNFENILNFISNYKFLNGICILLKPNNSRLNIVFRFCIQELLSHLHKSAKDNIVFCFTNTRGTFYLPGDTLPSLKEQLKKLKECSKVEIKINKNTVYCFDNESFRFLAAINNNIKSIQRKEHNFAESWKKSVDESKRLIEYIAEQIRQLIQTNIKLIKVKQNEIENSKQTIEELRDKLYIPQIDLEPVQLGYSRTHHAANQGPFFIYDIDIDIDIDTDTDTDTVVDISIDIDIDIDPSIFNFVRIAVLYIGLESENWMMIT